MNEKLSALMDGELGEFETRRLLTEMERDPQLRAAWERYHLARAALRNEMDMAAPADLTGRIAARLDEAVAPVTGRSPILHWRRYAGTAALAASVAAVAILGAQSFLASAPTPVAPLAGSPVSPVQTAATGKPKSVLPLNANSPEVERTLNTYLVEHNEFAPSGGVGGLLPYVRVVGKDANR